MRRSITSLVIVASGFVMLAGGTNMKDTLGGSTPANLGETVHYNGSRWARSDFLVNTGDRVGIGVVPSNGVVDVAGSPAGGNQAAVAVNNAGTGLTAMLERVSSSAVAPNVDIHTANATDDQPVLRIRSNGAGDLLQAWRDSAATLPALIVQESGMVGIGTDLPTDDLHVVGGVLVDGSIRTSGGFDLPPV